MPAEQTATYASRPVGIRALKRERSRRRLARRQCRDVAEVRAYQLESIRNVVRDAAAHVAFYRERFRCIGLGAEDIRTFDDYARIMLLTRSDIVNHLPESWSRAAKSG